MKTTYSKKRSWGLILFGIPFASVGIGILLFSVIPTLYDWTRMSYWDAASAQLVRAEVQVHYGDSTTYSATAQYRYRYAGQDYSSNRVAINSGNDNIGSFQEDLGYQLESAFKRETPIDIWVNPNNPQESIIDRSLRVGLFVFKLVFVVVFGGAGIGLMVFGWKVTEDYIETTENVNTPWLNHKNWATNQIRSEQKIAIWVTSAFALFWNAIAFPITFFVLPEAFSTENYIALVILLFPFVGIGLAYWAIKTIVDFRRYGDPILSLDPFPGSIGGHFGAHIKLPLFYSPKYRFNISLNCLQVEFNSGTDNETRESLFWQIDGLAKVKPDIDGIHISFRFDIPDNLPASEPENNKCHFKWRLDIESSQLHPKFSRQYTVPVYLTNQNSHEIKEDAESHPQLQNERESSIESVINIEKIPGGIKLYMPYFRHSGAKLMGMFAGLAFGGFGWLAGANDAPFIFPFVFGGVGILLVIACLYSLINCLKIDLDQKGMRYERCLLGIRINQQNIPKEKIQKLFLKESYSSQTGDKHQTVYQVRVQLIHGKHLTIADSLKGLSTAKQMLESLSLLTGYPADIQQPK